MQFLKATICIGHWMAVPLSMRGLIASAAASGSAGELAGQAAKLIITVRRQGPLPVLTRGPVPPMFNTFVN